MLIKFLKHGKGHAQLAASYLIDEVDHLNRKRAEVQVLAGDPQTFGAICDAIPHKWKYTSAVIAWSVEDDLSPEQIKEVLFEFEQHAFAGLKPHRYHMLAVMHQEDNGSKHVHVLVPRIDLETGKSLNIAPPGHRHYFDPLRNYFNYKYGWSRPDDPLRMKTTQESDHVHLQLASALKAGLQGLPKETVKQVVNSGLELYAKHRLIKNYADVCHALKTFQGVSKVEPHPDAKTPYIAIFIQDRKQAIRLKGEFYDPEFCIESYIAARAGKSAAGNNAEPNLQLAEDYCKQFRNLRDKRASYYSEVYGDAGADRRAGRRPVRHSDYPYAGNNPENRRLAQHSVAVDGRSGGSLVYRYVADNGSLHRVGYLDRFPGKNPADRTATQSAAQRSGSFASGSPRTEHRPDRELSPDNVRSTATEAAAVPQRPDRASSGDTRRVRQAAENDADGRESPLYSYHSGRFITHHDLLAYLCQQRDLQQKQPAGISGQSGPATAARPAEIRLRNPAASNAIDEREKLNEQRIDHLVSAANRAINSAMRVTRGTEPAFDREKPAINDLESTVKRKKLENEGSNRGVEDLCQGPSREEQRTDPNPQPIEISRDSKTDYSGYFSEFANLLARTIRKIFRSAKAVYAAASGTAGETTDHVPDPTTTGQPGARSFALTEADFGTIKDAATLARSRHAAKKPKDGGYDLEI